MVQLEIVDDEAGLREFRPEWGRFLEAYPAPTPFQTPEWLITWWKHFGSGRLRTLIFREDGQAAGVLPCFVHEWNGRRQITLVGTGISDYADPVFAPHRINEIIECARAQLMGWSDWDVCLWQDLSDHTPLRALGAAQPDTPCSGIVIDQTYEAFLAGRPKDLRRNLRRYREKAEQIAPVRFDAADFMNAESMDALVALHRARWEKAGESGMIEANRSEAFLREVTEVLGARGSLKVFTVRFGGAIAAILLALHDNSTIFSYLSAFDPQHECFGFGRELLAEALRYAHEDGYRWWNFLRGDEAYKFSWGAQPIAKCRVVIER